MKARLVGLLIVASVFSVQAQSGKNKTVEKAYIGSRGMVHVVHSNGKDIEISKQKGEVNVIPPVVADDRQSAGWIVEFPNCCTSYPIPLMLVIYRPGKPILRLGGMPVWSWHYLDGGKQVAFYTNTVHGDYAPHYELHDVATGSLVHKLDGPLDEKSPSWTDRLQ